MPQHEQDGATFHAHCCPCGNHSSDGISRRGFIGGAAALGGIALTGLTWSALAAAENEEFQPPQRRPLVVKPLLCYRLPTRRSQTSWREWGGVHTQQDLDKEIAHIKGELDKLQAEADFPVKFLPLAAVQNPAELAGMKEELDSADLSLIYASGGGTDLLHAAVKRGQGRDHLLPPQVGTGILVVRDHQPRLSPPAHRHARPQRASTTRTWSSTTRTEILWRLRIVVRPAEHHRQPDLGRRRPRRLGHARRPETGQGPLQARHPHRLLRRTGQADQGGPGRSGRRRAARRRAEAYLKLPGTTLETERKFVDNAFLLEQVFRGLMKQADCRAMTINSCMGTIMPISETTACLPLSTLNDDGYMAFCESDFVVVPGGHAPAEHRRPAAVPERSDLSARRPDHAGPLHRPAEDGRQDDRAGADPDPLRVGLRRRPEGRDAQGAEVVTNIIPDFKAER